MVLHLFRAMSVEHDIFPFIQKACQWAEEAMLDSLQADGGGEPARTPVLTASANKVSMMHSKSCQAIPQGIGA